MADTAGASFAIIDYMHVVEVPVAVAETGVNRRVGETEEVLFVTAQTCPIDSFFVGGVNIGGIASHEHPKIIRTVRVMARLAFSGFDGAMEMFFPGKFLFDVSQAGIAQIVLAVAEQASGHLVEGEEAFVLRIVGRVAGDTASLLLEGLVRHFNSCQFLAYLDMALEAEIRHLLLE